MNLLELSLPAPSQSLLEAVVLVVAGVIIWFTRGLFRSTGSDGRSTATPTTVGLALVILSLRNRLRRDVL